MNSRNFHISSRRESERKEEDDLAHIFSIPTQSSQESSQQSGHTVDRQSQSFIDSEQPVYIGETATCEAPSWKLSVEDSNNGDSQRTNRKGSAGSFLTNIQSGPTEKEAVKPQGTTLPVQSTSEFSSNALSERKKRLEAVIGAAKERASRSFGSPSTSGESFIRQPKVKGENVDERSERPKLTARAIRERLAASKYASFRTRSTAGSSVSSTTSLPVSRHNEERSPVISRSPATSRRKPVLDARSITGTESYNATFHERFTSTSSFDDKIRSADELLSRLEMNTSSSSKQFVSQLEHDNEEESAIQKTSEMRSSQESFVSSSALATNESKCLSSYSGSIQEANTTGLDKSLSPRKPEQPSFHFVDSGRMNTSDDLSCIFETKDPFEFQFSPFDVPTQVEFGSDGNSQQVEQNLLNYPSSFEFSQKDTGVLDSLEHSTEEQKYFALPVNNWRNDDVINSGNENLPLVASPSSNVEDLSCIFQNEGQNNFSSLLSNVQEPLDDTPIALQSEDRNIGLEPTFEVSRGGHFAFDNSTFASGNSSVGTLSYRTKNDPVYMKEEMEEVHLGDSEPGEDAVEQSRFGGSLNSQNAFLPSFSIDARQTQTSFKSLESNAHFESSPIFPEKHAIVCFGPHGYLLTSFPHMIPGFRVWNGREYVEDSSSVVVKPGAINIVPFIEIVEDTEERFFECIRNLHEDLIYSLGVEPMKTFCEKIALSCKRRSESLLWNILKVLSSHSKETEWHSLCIELKSILSTTQEDEFASLTAQLGKTGNVNDFNVRSLEHLSSKSSKLDHFLQTAVATENWTLALILSRLVGSSLREHITRQFLYGQLQDLPLIRFLILLSNDVVPNLSELESVNWITATSILIDCDTGYREKGLTALGDHLLMHRSDIFASHCCYILAGNPLCFDSFFASRLLWEEKGLRMILVGADPHSSVRASLTSIPSIMRTIFYLYLRENRLPNLMSPFLLHLAYVLVETGRLVLAKRLCGFLVNKAHTLLKSNDPHFVSEAQRLTAVYYSYLERLDERLQKMLLDDSYEQGEHGVSLTRSLSKVFRSIAKTGSKKNLRPRSSSNSSWESFAAAAVSIIAPAEENDTTSSSKYVRNSNIIPSSETTNTENIPNVVASPVRSNESAGQGQSPFQRTPDKETAHGKLASNQPFSKGDFPNSAPGTRVAAEDNIQRTSNGSQSGVENGSHEKKQSSRRSLSSFLMEKLTKIAGPKQANLGKENKFYYDEKLGRWICEGGEENNEEVPPPPPSKPLDSSNISQNTYMKEPEEIQDDMHRAMSRRRWSARARYVDTFGQADQISGTKPPLVVPPSAATRQLFKHSDPSDNPQFGFSMFTPVPTQSSFSDKDNTDWNASSYSESPVNNVYDATGTNN
ncbi:hypothetical protein Gasu2_13510 [Galdieria sulphuraria]|nr:hypothetical protein Gasu2_13510 [Galdieria sulphuraria]